MDIFGQPFGLPSSPDPEWRADEVLYELDDRDHLLTRIQIVGGSFPHMDAEPFVRVKGWRDSARSWFVDIAEDSTTMSAYFPVDAIPSDGVIEYGYGNRLFGRLARRFSARAVERLDRERLPRTVVVVTSNVLRRRESGRRPPKLRMPKPRQSPTAD
jgi:hypothetical protein